MTVVIFHRHVKKNRPLIISEGDFVFKIYLLHAELVDAAVLVGLAWAEE